MGLIKMLQQFHERKAEENAELSARWEERDLGISGSPREAYKKGYKDAYSMFRSTCNTIVSLIGITFLGYMFVEKDSDYLSQIKYQRQESQAKQERIIDFYQRHGKIPKGVSPAYLELRTQLWQSEVENNKLNHF